VRQVGYLQEPNRDARSTEHKKHITRGQPHPSSPNAKFWAPTWKNLTVAFGNSANAFKHGPVK